MQILGVASYSLLNTHYPTGACYKGYRPVEKKVTIFILHVAYIAEKEMIIYNLYYKHPIVNEDSVIVYFG